MEMIKNQLAINNHQISWHWNWSITWRWILHWRLWKPNIKMGAYFHKTYSGRGFMCGLNIRRIGHIGVQVQPNLHIDPDKSTPQT